MGLPWVLEQQARQNRLDAAYEASGRADRAHPEHSLYSGLVATQEPAMVAAPPVPDDLPEDEDTGEGEEE